MQKICLFANLGFNWKLRFCPYFGCRFNCSQFCHQSKVRCHCQRLNILKGCDLLILPPILNIKLSYLIKQQFSPFAFVGSGKRSACILYFLQICSRNCLPKFTWTSIIVSDEGGTRSVLNDVSNKRQTENFVGKSTRTLQLF